jgi:hypothetical protein
MMCEIDDDDYDDDFDFDGTGWSKRHMRKGRHSSSPTARFCNSQTARIKPLDDGGCPMNVGQQYPHELCTVSDAGPCSKPGNATVTPEDVGR